MPTGSTNNSTNNSDLLRKQIEAGQLCIGMGVSFCDPAISELIAEAGYDFTWIDLEHGSIDMAAALGHTMALRGTQTAPFIRVRSNDVNVIKPVLDLAPAGIIIPQVNSGEEAEAAVRACRYPPRGIRGFGPRRGCRFGSVPTSQYLKASEHEPIVVVQIEHIDAVDRLEDIAAVDGVDVVCIGPNDLSGSMGKLGQFDDPQVLAAFEAFARKARAADALLGVSTFYSEDNLAWWLQRGVKWINLGVDFANLFKSSHEVLEAARTSAR